MLISYLPSFLEFICFYFTTKTFQKASYKPQKNDILFCFIITSLIGTIPDSYSVLLFILGQLLLLVYTIISLKKSKINGIILYILSLGTVAIIQLSLSIIFTLFHISMTSSFMNIVGNVLTLLGLFLLLFFTKLKELYQTIIQSAKPFRLIFINTILFFLCTIIIWKLFPRARFYTYGGITFILLILIATNACILYYDQKMQSQKQELDTYKKNLPIYEALITEIRASQHAYTNRLQTIQNMTHLYSDYDSLCEAICDHTTEYRKPLQAYPLLQINMPLLAAALYHQYCVAQQRQIEMHFNITTTKLQSKFGEPKIADWICILTENAIEACNPGDSIYVDLSSEQGEIHFEIRNPVPKHFSIKEIQNLFTKYYTTKSTDIKKDDTPRGLGLYSLMHDLKRTTGWVGAECVAYNGGFWMVFRLNL